MASPLMKNLLLVLDIDIDMGTVLIAWILLDLGRGRSYKFSKYMFSKAILICHFLNFITYLQLM